MQNFKYDGWKESDWEDVSLYSRVLLNTANNLDNAVGGGGGGFTPAQLLVIAEHTETISKRLRDIAQGYI